jgi:uncharacterized protein (TIGR02466 family)
MAAMTQHNLFATPVQIVKIIPTAEEHDKTQRLLSRIYADCTENAWALEGGKSTGEHGLMLHGCSEMNWLTNAAMEYAKEYWKILEYKQDPTIWLGLESSWANLHKQGHATGEHSHCGGWSKAHISTVYYFKKPANSGNIEFVHPLEYVLRMTPAEEFSEIKGVYNEFPAKEFDLILFPSWLSHRTQINKSTEDRIAISMNFQGKK